MDIIKGKKVGKKLILQKVKKSLLLIEQIVKIIYICKSNSKKITDRT